MRFYSARNCMIAGSIGLLILNLAAASVAAAEVKTILGTGEQGYSGDGGPAIQAKCAEPFGVVIGPDGALYVCETQNHLIRRVDLQTGIATTVAGTGERGWSGDGGPATEAKLFEPYEVRFDPAGNMVFVEMQNHLVRRVDRETGIIDTIAGRGAQGYAGDDGPALEAKFNRPHSIAYDDAGNLYICDIGNHRVRIFRPRTKIRNGKDRVSSFVDLEVGHVTTLLGNGKKGELPDGAKIGKIPVSGPRALDFDGKSLWLALREGNAIYRLDLDHGTVEHIAGVGGPAGYAGDGGLALQAKLAGPKGIAIDEDGNVVFADTESHTIRRIDAETGIITTIVGTGERGDGPDGDPLECRLNRPHSVCFGPDGEVYIGDSSNNRVRVYYP